MKRFIGLFTVFLLAACGESPTSLDSLTDPSIAPELSTAPIAPSLSAPESASSILLGTTKWIGTSMSELLEINKADGVTIRTIGDIGYQVNGLEYDATTGTLYASTAGGEDGHRGLITIDMATGEGTPIGASWDQKISKITIDSDGNMFGWNDSNDKLVAIDKADGGVREIGETHSAAAKHGLDFGSDGLLWLVVAGELFTVDTTSGVWTSTDEWVGGPHAHHGDIDLSADYYYGISDTYNSSQWPNLALRIIDLAGATKLHDYYLLDDDVHVVTFVPEIPSSDTTPPGISYTLSGAMGEYDWFTSPVMVAWNVVDDESDVIIGPGCDSWLEYAEDGAGQVASCTATSAGGTAVTTVSFNIDQTPPEVNYLGNSVVDDIAEDIDITCTAADETSGIPSSGGCTPVAGGAWSFGLGRHPLATVHDNAGLTSTDDGFFEVEASIAGLTTLVERWVTHRGTVNSLSAKLNADEGKSNKGKSNKGKSKKGKSKKGKSKKGKSKRGQGRADAEDGSLAAFIHQVEAQTGKKVPADKAPYLIAFAEALMN